MSQYSQDPHSTGRAEAGRMENQTANASVQSRLRKRNSGFMMPDELTPRQLTKFLDKVPTYELSKRVTNALKPRIERPQQLPSTSGNSSSSMTLQNISQRTEEFVRYEFDEPTFAIPAGPRVGSNVSLASQRPTDYDDDMIGEDDEDETEPPAGPPEPPTGPLEPPTGPVDPMSHIPVLNRNPDNTEFSIVNAKVKNLENPKPSCIVRQLFRLGFPNFTEADIHLPSKCVHPMRLTEHCEVVIFTVIDPEKARTLQNFLLSTNYHRTTLERNKFNNEFDIREHAYLSTAMTKEQAQLCGLLYACCWIYKEVHPELQVFFGGDRLVVEDDDSTYNLHLTDLIRNEKDIVRQGKKLVSRRKTTVVSNAIRAVDPQFQFSSNRSTST